jgi:hypothetical protein
MEDLQQEQKSKIKYWVHKELRLDHQCVVLLSEMDHWKDCTNKETLILAINDCYKGNAKAYKIKKCISEITEKDVSNLLDSSSAFEKEHLSHTCSQLVKNLLEKNLL